MGSPMHASATMGRANPGHIQPVQHNVSKSPQAFNNKSPSQSMQISNLVGSTSPQPSPSNSRLSLITNNTPVATVAMPNTQNRVSQQAQQVSFSHQPAVLVNNQAVVTLAQQQQAQTTVIRSPQQQQQQPQPVQIPLIKQSQQPLPSV